MTPAEPKLILFPHDWEDLDSSELAAVLKYFGGVSAREAYGRWVTCKCPKLVLYYIDNSIDVRTS